MFGLIDIVGSSYKDGMIDLDNWMIRRHELLRQFTVMAATNCEMLTLHINDLNRMKQEFNSFYEKLFEDSIVRLKRAW